jgi:RND family efflux transporter MFP subunit
MKSHVQLKVWLALIGAGCLAHVTHAAQPLACLIEPQRVAEIGSPVIGVVETLLVERGDRVTKGQVIAVLRADVERAAVGVAQSRADAEAEEQAASAAAAHARQRLTRARDLHSQNFISDNALDQAKVESDLADRKLAQMREQRRISVRERELASTQLAQRTIRSPFDGVIVERYVSPGERVETKPLLRVAQIDPLKVLVVVPAALYGRVSVGAGVAVTPQLPNTAPLRARVTLVDTLIDAPSNTFRIQLELPNPERNVPAGLRCAADLGLESMAEPRTPVAAAANAARRGL